MDEKLVFRRARPADAARIMEIIRQAQAQMRALGSLQWQDGYPAAADIGHDIACGYGWVFEKPEAEKSTDARGTDGTGAAGFRAVTAAAGKTTGTEAAGKTGVSGADETAAAAEEAEERGLGVVSLNGKMIDGPIIDHARKVVALSASGIRD